jgi:hypothetical protein
MKNVRTVPPCGANASVTARTKKGGFGAEALPLGRVALLVPRARREARVAQALQQLVRAVEAVADAELAFEDPHHVLPAQRAGAAVGGRRPGVQPGHQLGLPVAGQPGRAAGPRLGRGRVDPAVAVGVHPPLDAAAGPTDRLGDVVRRLALQRQQHRAVAVASRGVPLARRTAAQFLSVPRLSLGHLHHGLLGRSRILPCPSR